MCVNGNSAPLSVRYINGQLSTLWENAVECVNTGGNAEVVDIKSDEYDKHKYTRALAEFHLLGRTRNKGPFPREELFFSASFDKPRLEFACNHEAVLYLKLNDGHLNKEYKQVKELGYRVSRSHNVPFKGLEIAFRMRFDRHSIQGKSSKIGNQAVVQFLILDFHSAKMVITRPDRELSMSHDILDALEFYMRQYLSFLHGAGHHTLFDLPDFDNDKYSPHIDHSINSTIFGFQQLCQDITIFGTSISSINYHLQHAWIKVASKAHGVLGSPPADHLSTCLYEIKSTWLSHTPSTHFHIKFNPPTVRALCSHEVVLYFTLQELSFFKTDIFDIPCGSYRDWENKSKWQIAFIVDVKEVKEAGGCITRIMLDLKSARFSRHLSIFHCHEPAAIEFFNLIVEFMTTDYTTLLIDYKFYDIYWVDTRIPGFHGITEESESSDGEWRPVKTERSEAAVTVSWSETVEQINICGFDQVLAISEESINALFKSWWNSAKGSHTHCLFGYAFEHSFKVTFRPARVQLLSGNRAIIWVTIDDGYLLLDEDDRHYDCSGWSIAYEVDIKMIEHHEMHHVDFDPRFIHAPVVTVHGHDEHRHIRHVIFDFANAQFSYELSNLEGIFDHGADVAISRLRSIKNDMDGYLQLLARSGHNIVHSVPIFKQAATFGLTEVGIQVVAKTVVTVHNVSHVHEAPVLLILGMLQHRPLPTATIGWGAGWVIPPRKGHVSYGTICLSRRIFLEARILHLLERINRRTTVIPRFPDDNEDEYTVYLTTWDQHRHRHNRECKWTLSNTNEPGWLEYLFDHKDVREYSHEMSGDTPEISEYSVTCHTRNQLLIPTAYYPGCMEIVMRGHSIIRLKGKSEHNKWRKSTSAKWQASIRIYTSANGLRVEVSKDITPEFSEHETEGQFNLLEALQLHQQNLPQVIKFDEILGELKKILESAWDYSYPSGTCYTLASPVFTRHGDLVVQVRPHDPHANPLVAEDPRRRLTVNLKLPAFETPLPTPSPLTHGHPFPTAPKPSAPPSITLKVPTTSPVPKPPASYAATAAAPKAPVPPAAKPATPPKQGNEHNHDAGNSILGRVMHAAHDYLNGERHEDHDNHKSKSRSSSSSSSESNSPHPVTPVPRATNPLGIAGKGQHVVPQVQARSAENED